VAFYRIYQIGADDRIKGAISFECATDQEALAKARELLKVFPLIEVWTGTRRIACMDGAASGRSALP
jgi:hypothetical protein